jgi:nicotinamide-nucleotide amidase
VNELKDLLLAPPPLSLAVAESLTCGALQLTIGRISGASQFFRGGITAYSLEQKVRHLGVDRAAAAATNSVSAAVAEQMARGACALFGTDLGVGTTGYAEADPAAGIAEPFAWWGLARRLPGGAFEVRSSRVDASGASRAGAQDAAAAAAFAALLAWVRALRARSSARTPSAG